MEASGACISEPINEHLLHGKVEQSHVRGCVCSHRVCYRQRQDEILVHALETVASVPQNDKLFVLMDANVRTGKRDRGGSLEYAQVVGPYGRDVLNDNCKQMAIANTFFSTPKGGQQPTFVSPKGDAWRLDYILTPMQIDDSSAR